MTLPAGEAHLWKASLDRCTDTERPFLESLLDGRERGRAERFYFERDRKRFVVARGLLRGLIGRYLDAQPASLEFGYTERGKPFLKTPDATLRFNVSHSDGYALFAFADGREVGVDVEAGARLGDDWPAIARRYFSQREQAELDSLPAERRRAAFLRGWARKEAYLKATGLGIVDGLQKIEVKLGPEQPPVFLAPEIAACWAFGDAGASDETMPAAAFVLERRGVDETSLRVRHFTCDGGSLLPKE